MLIIKENAMENPILFIIPGACSLGSMITLEWIATPYHIGITTPEIRASTAFRSINPTGKVGALQEGNTVIGENLAILLYLADKHPTNPICPTVGNPDRVKVYQWLSYISATLHPAFSQVLFPQRFIAEAHTAEFKQLAIVRLHAVLEYMDSQILPSGFFIADSPCIVDAQAYAILRWSRGFKGGNQIIEINNFAKICNFLQLMEQNLAVQNALNVEQERPNLLRHSQFAGYFKICD